MKALSIKQPWAYLIACGLKDIENRTWKTNFRGRIYIHASSISANEAYMIFSDEQANKIFIESDFDVEMFESYKQTSQIIGEVDIVDCIINHTSIWAEKSLEGIYLESDIKVNKEEKPIYNWVLTNPVLYEKPILNVKGKLSFWEFEKPENF